MLIRVADLTVELNTPLATNPFFCRDYRLDDGTPDFSVSVTSEQREYEKTIVSDPLTDTAAENNALCRGIARELSFRDGFLLHAAVVEMEGCGYAFSAASGTGKSTHVSYWKEAFGDRARIINGDKPFVRCVDGVFYAYGSPWCGKEGWNVNARVPLCALAFLERGENRVWRMETADAVEALLRHTLMPSDGAAMPAYLDVLDRFVKAVPIDRISCNMSPQAAVVAWEGMKK